MQTEKLKIVWICEFSNESIRNKLYFRIYSPLFILKKLKGHIIFRDLSQWITNGIQEFKRFENIELHVISPHPYILAKIQSFNDNNITYHFFRSEDDSFVTRLKRKFFASPINADYPKNAYLINKIITEINPDIIHLIGAEIPYFSSSVLSLKKQKPLFVSLQTLMSDPEFFTNYPIDKVSYDIRSNIEKKVIRNADYIGTSIIKFAKEIRQNIKKNAIFISCKLAVAEPIHDEKCNKQYDFVYFSKEIEKAVDWVIESFTIAHESNPQMTLLIVGGYSKEYKEELDEQLLKKGLMNNITFTGTLPTHDDVINKIKEAKFAILPLKIDLISGTIREAMSCGLPVITTRTEGTPDLNTKRECILISEPNDFQDMANKMICLMNDSHYADILRNNSFKTINERYNNTLAMQGWVDAYKAIIKHYHHNTPIPTHLLLNI